MAKKKGKSKLQKHSTVIKTVSESENSKAVPFAIAPGSQTVFMKVCRLCEAKDGPFLNIFDAEKITAKRINDLMPFEILENDDLPHKICFRCSAKVEELHEFVQKCIKAQENLRLALGITDSLCTKTKTIMRWEEKLSKSKMSNDDICDALIKKAMEGIKDIPLKSIQQDLAKELSIPKEELKQKQNDKIKKQNENFKKQDENDGQIDIAKQSNEDVKKVEADLTKHKEEEKEIDDCDVTLKQLQNEKNVQDYIPVRASRSKSAHLLDGIETVYKGRKSANKSVESPISNITSAANSEDETLISVPQRGSKIKKNKLRNGNAKTSNSNCMNSSLEETLKKKPVTQAQEQVKPFNIMDHVSTIKVNGVGILFQCKLCNRNFLKEDVVMSHGCAKNGGPKITDKIDLTRNVSPPEPPKAPSVKYINTKELDAKNNTASQAKSKPKVGPASRIKRDDSEPQLDIGIVVNPNESNPSLASPVEPQVEPMLQTSGSFPSFKLPNALSLQSRYKLVPGPNNTFTLIEDNNRQKKYDAQNDSTRNDNMQNDITQNNNTENDVQIVQKPVESKPKSKSKERKPKGPGKGKKLLNQEVIDLDEQTPIPIPQNVQEANQQQPYPVGLFQTLPHHSSTYPLQALPHHSATYPPPLVPNSQPTFTTPAMKKQSYTIVQTGNPSKLLISTKPQPPSKPIEIPEPPKKRQKKSKPETATDEGKQPFSVTVEDTTRSKDAGFFTFINVDPLLQPSYVLPTQSIIQESQITTSTPIVKPNSDSKDLKYSCNMCDQKFTREKKLLTHIQSHYTQMDEEDKKRTEKPTSKRTRRS